MERERWAGRQQVATALDAPLSVALWPTVFRERTVEFSMLGFGASHRRGRQMKDPDLDDQPYPGAEGLRPCGGCGDASWVYYPLYHSTSGLIVIRKRGEEDAARHIDLTECIF